MREIYRVYMTEGMRALVGIEPHYHELSGISEPQDFDAEAVVASVASAICSGGD